MTQASLNTPFSAAIEAAMARVTFIMLILGAICAAMTCVGVGVSESMPPFHKPPTRSLAGGASTIQSDAQKQEIKSEKSKQHLSAKGDGGKGRGGGGTDQARETFYASG